MLFRFGHHSKRGCIREGVPRPVPVNDDAINSATDHVPDLTMNLRWILRVVAHAHVARITKPRHEVRIDLCAVARVQQRVHIHFADVGRPQVPVALRLKAICGAGVVGGLRLKRSGRNNL